MNTFECSAIEMKNSAQFAIILGTVISKRLNSMLLLINHFKYSKGGVKNFCNTMLIESGGHYFWQQLKGNETGVVVTLMMSQ